MRLVTFERNGMSVVGSIRPEDRVLAFEEANILVNRHPRYHFSSMLDLIEKGQGALEIARQLDANPPDDALIELLALAQVKPVFG